MTEKAIKKEFRFGLSTELIILLVCFAMYLTWAILEPAGYGPDELMRKEVIDFILKHRTLPIGTEPELLSNLWGTTYALLPFYLGTLFSTLFASVASLFTASPAVLLVAMRLTSVLFGTLMVFFAIRLAKAFTKSPVGLMFPLLLGLLPQVVFLASYINNDIISLCGTVMILYAWKKGMEKWTIPVSVLLAVGISVVALSYYFAYGWIVMSLLFAALTCGLKIGGNAGMKFFLKRGALVLGIALLLSGLFFIRNAVHFNGDILGMSVVDALKEQYAAPGYKPGDRETPLRLGMSLFEMFRTTYFNSRSWPVLTYMSTIGMLGGLDVFVGPMILGVLSGVFFLGIALYAGFRRTPEKGAMLYRICALIGMLIPIGFSVYYSYTSDYQAQGRYIITALPPFLGFVSLGFTAAASRLSKKIPGSHKVDPGKVFLIGFGFMMIAFIVKVTLRNLIPSF